LFLSQLVALESLVLRATDITSTSIEVARWRSTYRHDENKPDNAPPQPPSLSLRFSKTIKRFSARKATIAMHNDNHIPP
jgi:hypothetical protein